MSRVRLTFVRSVARPVPRAEAAAARRLQRMSAGQRSANCNRRDAVALAIGAGSSAAGPKPGRVNCSEKLGRAFRKQLHDDRAELTMRTINFVREKVIAEIKGGLRKRPIEVLKCRTDHHFGVVIHW